MEVNGVQLPADVKTSQVNLPQGGVQTTAGVIAPQGVLEYCTCQPGKDNPHYSATVQNVGLVCLFCNKPRQQKKDGEVKAPEVKVEAQTLPVTPPVKEAVPTPDQIKMVAYKLELDNFLRDYFACAAMSGLSQQAGGKMTSAQCDKVAALCYKMADAMLKERATK
jgi:hypothetical protein